MAYFSNGTEGELYRKLYCFRCRHFDAADGARECAVWSVHLLFAYEQDTNPELGMALDELIPMETWKGNSTVKVAGRCAMFLAWEGRDG